MATNSNSNGPRLRDPILTCPDAPWVAAASSGSRRVQQRARRATAAGQVYTRSLDALRRLAGKPAERAAAPGSGADCAERARLLTRAQDFVERVGPPARDWERRAALGRLAKGSLGVGYAGHARGDLVRAVVGEVSLPSAKDKVSVGGVGRVKECLRTGILRQPEPTREEM